MAIPPWRTGRVIKVLEETYNTRRYFIEVNDCSSFDFKAGQFVTLDLPIHEKPGRRWRSYSIASHPDGSNIIELLIVLLEGGAGTTYIFNEVKIGSELSLRGPQGNFVLPDSIPLDLFLVCTGTGIAPFRSMLYDIIQKEIPHKNIYLAFGCRTKQDLLYHDEMRALEERMPSFQYIPTLSREKWDGRSGYVHNIYEEICKASRDACTDLNEISPACFFLCGWKFMIQDARNKIQAMGYNKTSIRFELYG